MARAKTPASGEDATDAPDLAIAAVVEEVPEAEIVPPRAPEPPPAPEPAPEPVAGPAPRRPVFVPLVLGGVLAALGGFAVARAVPGGWPAASTAALEAQLAAQKADIDRLTAVLAERPAPVMPDLSPVEDRIDAVAAEVAALAGQVAAIPAPVAAPDLSPQLAALEARLAALEAMPLAAGSGDPAAAAQIARDLAAVRAELQAQKDSAAAATAGVTEAAALATAALAEAQAQTAALRDEAAAAVAAARRDAALGRITAAVDSGAPFSGALADLGGDVPEVLAVVAETGAPTLLSLQVGFPEAARAALEASLKADMGETTMERLGSFLRTQTGARSITPREGTDPDAVLSRAAAAVERGDLAAALAETSALPEPGQAALADWTARARARLDAAAAVAALTAAP
jgi:hypothetical protein